MYGLIQIVKRAKIIEMTIGYDSWIKEVRAVLASINMPMEHWQKVWPFDFAKEFLDSISADSAAAKANRFWWRELNRSIGHDCSKDPDCWLPNGHQGDCQTV